MPYLLPPKGVQDAERLHSLSPGDRDYMEFCLEFCGKIIEKRPHQIEALTSVATCLTELGFYADGLKVDEILASLNPKDATVQYNLACSHALNKNKDAAIESLDKAIDLGYADHSHMQFDKDLANIRHDPRFLPLVEKALLLQTDDEEDDE